MYVYIRASGENKISELHILTMDVIECDRKERVPLQNFVLMVHPSVYGRYNIRN